MARRNNKLKTKGGNPVDGQPERLRFATRMYAKYGYIRAREMIVAKWGIGESTAERDLTIARKAIADQAERERPFLRERLTEHLTRVAADAHNDKRFSAAVQADRAIAKLNGLEIDVVKLETKSSAPDEFDNASDEDLDRAISEADAVAVAKH
jgi:hypothetical protein